MDIETTIETSDAEISVEDYMKDFDFDSGEIKEPTESSEPTADPEPTEDADPTETNEPENKDPEPTDEELPDDDISHLDERFIKDGKPNFKAIAKSVSDMDVNWEKLKERENALNERENQINQVPQMTPAQQTLHAAQQEANIEAHLYGNYLNYANDPAAAYQALLQHANFPTQETKQLIDELFPVDVHKTVTKETSEYKTALEQQSQTQNLAKQEKEHREYLTKVVGDNKERFLNEDFKKLFTMAYRAIGTNLNTDEFFGALDNLKTSWLKENELAQKAGIEKEAELEKIQNSAPKGTSPKGKISVNDKSFDALSDEERKNAVNDCIKEILS